MPPKGVVDYLSPEQVYPSGRQPSAGFEAEEVKYAVLCLMLNPNATWARFKLLWYAFGDKTRGRGIADEVEFLAAKAFTITRLARSIHKYDRHRQTLQSFIFHVFDYAKKDVHDVKAAVREAFLGKAGLADGAAPSVHGMEDRDAPFRPAWEEFYREALLERATRDVAGKFVKYPFRRQEHVDGVAMVRPLPFLSLPFEDGELEKALALCERDGTPVCAPMTGFGGGRTPDERRAILARFKAWWKKGCKDWWEGDEARAEFAFAMFELNFLEGLNLDRILDRLRDEGRYAGKTKGQVSRALYVIARPLFKAFEADDEALSQEKAREEAYERLRGRLRR
ncbi:MAG: hypothetical protein LBT74_05895 [Acidobacteriota bacterium]|jgi:hypothetical protein|nr:hypothetical protein [Acidobacteriota bacterium]